MRRFDVSLRDGLQSLQKVFTLGEKKHMLNSIMRKWKPEGMEVGSLVSEKILPQMKDSIPLYHYARQKYPHMDFFLLVPPVEKYLTLAKKENISNISLITSVSEAFQRRNVNQSIGQTKDILASLPPDFQRVKLYVSCITECPLAGKGCNHKIINDLLYYSTNKKIHEICLSDTTGTLKFTDFKYIMDHLLVENLPPNRLSLHLHQSPDMGQIIRYASGLNVKRFDVSHFSNMGGCSVTMDRGAMHGNLTYTDLSLIMRTFQ